jgi:hypothetical protein
LSRKALSARASAAAGSVSPQLRANATMRSQRSGSGSARRSDERPRLSRKRATTALAEIMKNSMSSLARLRSSGFRSMSAVPWYTACASSVVSVSDPWARRTRLSS